jgi:mRNA-degrading endonuclease RelE of RelBE toxin-antitoxin system
MSELVKKIQKLPPDLQKEVEQLVDELVNISQSPKKHLKLTWAGGLKEHRDKFTSLQLQKKVMEWWGD